MPEKFKKVAIIGLGLMGGSLAMALKTHPDVERVAGFARTRATRDKARELELADFIPDTAAEAVRGCDLVFIAAPVGTLVEIFRDISGELAQGAVVTDMGSVKLDIVEKIEGLSPPGVRYVGGHPMTGSEQSGIDSARPDLYRDCYYILTPTEKTDPDAFSRLHGFLATLGSRVLSMDPETHDRAMATISHVPHLLSLLLMEMADRQREQMKNLFTIAAGGFRDMTRIAASDPVMWVDICTGNRELIVEKLKEYERGIDQVISVLEKDDSERLREMFESAGRARAELSVKAGTEIADLFEVSIPVPDEPGVISRVSTAVGSLGINIEDIGIVHPLEGERGLLTLKVLGEGKAREAAGHLESLGYSASIRRA